MRGMPKLFVGTVCFTAMLIAESNNAGAAEHMAGESLVLAGETPGNVLGEKIDPKRVVVRSSYLPGGTVYEAGRDYRFDARARTITRAAG